MDNLKCVRAVPTTVVPLQIQAPDHCKTVCHVCSCLPACLFSAFLSVCLCVFLSFFLSFRLSTCLPAYLFANVYMCAYSYMYVMCDIEDDLLKQWPRKVRLILKTYWWVTDSLPTQHFCQKLPNASTADKRHAILSCRFRLIFWEACFKFGNHSHVSPWA